MISLPFSGCRSMGLAVLLAGVLAGCSKSADQTGADRGADRGSPSLALVAEDVVTLRSAGMVAGPSIVGSIQPERRADLRAEVAAMVVRVFRENGDVVKAGEVLLQLDDTAIRDALASAEAAGRTAELTLSQASRQLDRQHTLRQSGMTTAQSLEDAESRRNNALSEVEAAKARIVSARQQLTRTVIRAPFAGVVSDRKVSAGDTAQVGKELLKVVDPASLRFEGLVAAEQIGQVAAGQRVTLRVNGYGDKVFTGTVRRVNPVANTATRQAEVLVDLSGTDQPRLAGLYAEGRIETGTQRGLLLPAASLVREGDHAYAWAVREGALAKVELTVGERDERSGHLLVTKGLGAGDTVLRYPTGALKPGQAVRLAPPVAATPVAAPPSTGGK